MGMACRRIGDILAGAMQAVGIRTGAVVIALTMLICVVAIAGREPLRGTSGEPTETRQRPAEVVVAPPGEFPVPGALPPEVFVFEEEDSATPAWVRWTIAAISLAGILAAGVLLARELRGWRGRRRRRRSVRVTAPEGPAAQRPHADDEDDLEVARRAVEAALMPLRESADPRAVVIEAYARMEQVLAEQELGRRVPEAPREYLERLLLQQGMPEGSLTTLTALFEEARFSLHPIPESAPSRALNALEHARAGLAASKERN
jgi:uncharacterized protein DUF4129